VSSSDTSKRLATSSSSALGASARSSASACKGAVGEREILGLALQEGHLQPFGVGALPGPLQHLGNVDADGPAEAAGGRQGGRLRLASLPTAIATLVPHAVALFTQRHPDVDLTVVDDHQQGLIPRLARWELDLALIYDHEALPEPEVRLDRTSLLDDPFDLLVPDGHPLARRRSVAMEELADETWIGGTPDGAYARIVLHSCRVAGFEPRVVFGSDDYNAVQAFVAVGLGVAILPRLALTFPRPGLARVALAGPPVRRIAAVRLAPSFRSAAATSMLGVLKETADAFGA
jgi:DNA-binding transcriptional LysR family regulator